MKKPMKKMKMGEQKSMEKEVKKMANKKPAPMMKKKAAKKACK